MRASTSTNKYVARRFLSLSTGLLLVTILGCSTSCSPPNTELDPSKITIVVPEDPQFQSFLPWQTRGALEREIVYNIYDGLFDALPPRGYGDGMATTLRQIDPGSSFEPEVTVDLEKDRSWVHPLNGVGDKVDAARVVQAWRTILTSPNFPERSLYTSVIKRVEKSSDRTLLVQFKTDIDLTKRAKEALSFRLFPVPLSQSIPEGSGPFVLKFPPPSERHRELLPSLTNFPAPDGRIRPRIEIRPIPSSRSRLDEVLASRAQVALAIPPYYLQDLGGSGYKPSDRYNVWAIVFSSSLAEAQRRHLAATIDASRLLRAFLLESQVLTQLLAQIHRQEEDLISPTIYPAEFEVFDCLDNKMAEGRLEDPNLATIGKRLRENPSGFNLPPTGDIAPFPDPFRVAFLDAGAYFEGTRKMAENLKQQLESNRMLSSVDLDGLSESDWLQALRTLASGSKYHAVIVRFSYGRRCDISDHFRDDLSPSPQGGLFNWTPLAWQSGDLKRLRELGQCDTAVEPTLRLIKTLHDLAPAKFLFSVPNLTVYDSRIDMDVHDEFSLASLWRWRVGQK